MEGGGDTWPTTRDKLDEWEEMETGGDEDAGCDFMTAYLDCGGIGIVTLIGDLTEF
jgi:hypothetical protein